MQALLSTKSVGFKAVYSAYSFSAAAMLVCPFYENA